MTRTLYDGIAADVGHIPANAQMVAGYVDGLYAWSAADWARFPHAVKIRIAVFASTNDGHVLDCEPGNQGDPSQAVDWVLMRRAAGADPTVYCGRNTWWPTIRADFQARGVPEPHYWVADYSVDRNALVAPAPALALQYEDAGFYDLSIAPDYWPGVDAPPVQPPILPKDIDMILLTGFNGPAVAALSGGLLWNVQDGAAVNAYKAAGVPIATIDAAEYAAIVAAVAAAKSAPVTVDATALGTAIAAGLHIPTAFTGTLS